ncbi:MAG: two component transcriptional regulator, Fis family, partial [Akkermansiaceae bacterium]|nr:two component transcriptional regulator, Fis family [Akkermansiaceae bacterium]
MNASLRILLVDDDTVYLERLARSLRGMGCEVVTAETIGGATARAEEFKPQAAVLDLRLGAASGLDCLRALIKMEPRLRILMLTGYGSISTAMEAVREGAWDYLTKPADAEQILSALLSDPRQKEAQATSFQPPSLERLEWEHIQRVLTDHGGNITQTAEA